jgi:hypothetical protein
MRNKELDLGLHRLSRFDDTDGFAIEQMATSYFVFNFKAMRRCSWLGGLLADGWRPLYSLRVLGAHPRSSI